MCAKVNFVSKFPPNDVIICNNRKINRLLQIKSRVAEAGVHFRTHQNNNNPQNVKNVTQPGRYYAA